MGHLLTTTKKSEIPSKIIYFDSESWVNIGITPDEISKVEKKEKVEKPHKLYLAVSNFTDKNYKSQRDEWKDYTGTPERIQSCLWYDVVNFINAKQKVYVFAHNARYDVLVTGCIPEMIKLGFIIQSYSESNPFFIIFTNKKCKKECKDNKFCEYEKRGKSGVTTCAFPLKTVVVLSSTNYFAATLAKLGKIFKIPKMEVDYENVSVEDSIPYCRNDVLILKTAMQFYIQLIQDEDMGSFKYTLAGQSFQAFRHRFMDHEILIHRHKESLLLERGAYAGGRNEVFQMGKIDGIVYYLDVNSMYPFEMLMESYPITLLTYRRHTSIKECMNFIKQGYLVTTKCRVNVGMLNVFFKKEERLTFPTGRFITYLSTPEFIYGVENNLIEEVMGVSIYEGAKIFTSYVEHFYGCRLKAREEENDVLTYMYKIFMNSLYGKFGQKENYWERIDTCENPETIKEEHVINKDTGEKHILKIFGGGIFESIKKPDGENDAYNAFPAISAHVTAYARMLLWKFIILAGIENVYYTDTDSLFVNEIGYNRLTEFIDSSKLGFLKLEKSSNGVEIKGCKDYVFGKEVKLKGVPKNAVKINENEYAVTVWRGMAKGIKGGNLKDYSNDVIIKKLKRIYKKGKVEGNGKVTPIDYK